jgi:hypothetical protein
MAFRDKEKRKAYCKAYHKIWYAKNKEKRKSQTKSYYATNREDQKTNMKVYDSSHKVERRTYRRRKHETDPQFRLNHNLRSRIRHALKRGYKAGSTQELLGSSFETVYNYIFNLLKPGMTWKNYGLHTWHIDHVIPCYKFDLTKPEEQRKCFHYTNLQPLWAEEHKKKHAGET